MSWINVNEIEPLVIYYEDFVDNRKKIISDIAMLCSAGEFNSLPNVEIKKMSAEKRREDLLLHEQYMAVKKKYNI
ncbi:hypothetical protein [Vreelandella arctica]|uniref:hypothetical protein n=1 Tax=Vreelandella arctica TaxID=3126499 RepID=UPI00300DC13C